MAALETALAAIAAENGEPAIGWNRRLWEMIHAGQFDYLNGYIRHRYPEHPNADKEGRIYQHQIVASIMLGRPIDPEEEIHHWNEIRHDNWPHNIKVCLDSRDHGRQHRMSNRRYKANRKAAQP